MLKYLKYIFCILTSIQLTAFAVNTNDALIANIQYDWINKSIVEKESIISEIQDIIFKNDFERKTNLKSEFNTMLKDKNYKKHYLAASAGYKEFKDYNISAFYNGNSKYLYMYALQDKNDTTKNYYYDALGHLRYIDFIEGEYPEYPYYSYQYSILGKPISAIYYASKDTQYMFNPDKTFKGVWYKHNMYDENSKIILKRTSY